MKKILFVCAMKKEALEITKKLNMQEIKINGIKEESFYSNGVQSLLITGVGKQKTAIILTKYLTRINKDEKPELIINVGYAGSTDIPIGTWVNIVKSYNYEWLIPGEEQYSMNDFGNQKLIILDENKFNNKKIDNIQREKAIEKEQAKMPIIDCYSAESFVTATNLEGHIAFDMELHSIAIICDMEKIPLLALKKISDNLSLDKYYDNISNNEVMELTSCLNFIEI